MLWCVLAKVKQHEMQVEAGGSIRREREARATTQRGGGGDNDQNKVEVASS